ncbi:Isopropylmalate dehydrogenase-like domain-containing protein, partial [Rozella allomycis CSF55]
TSTNPIASIFAWTRGLSHRAKLDQNHELDHFCKTLDQACIDLVEKDRKMTKDLALVFYGSRMTKEHYLNTEDFINAIQQKLNVLLSNKT